MNEETSLVPIGNDAIRQIIEEKQSLSIGTLTSKEFRLTGRDSLSAPTGHRSFLLFRLPLRVGAEGQVA